MKRPASWVPCLLIGTGLVLGGGGCAGWGREGGKLAVASESSPGTVLSSAFETGVYAYDDQHNLLVLLFDGPPDNPRQAVTLRMFWRPRPASTPIDRTATNVTIQYIVFSGDARDPQTQVGVYSGSGYLFPKTRPGSDPLTASVWDANLRLSDRSEAFVDLLGKAQLRGGFTATRDDIATEQQRQKLMVLLRERLTYPRLVMHQP